jgi:N-acetylmuramoyl-L-alanine amidase
MSYRFRACFILATIVLKLSVCTSSISNAALGDRVLARGSRVPKLLNFKKIGYAGICCGTDRWNLRCPNSGKSKAVSEGAWLVVDGVAGPRTIAELKRLTGQSVTVGGTAVGYKNSDITLLARLISAEAKGEPYKGQIAVGAVVLNRIKSSSFPNTIPDVIYQPGAFSPLPMARFGKNPYLLQSVRHMRR